MNGNTAPNGGGISNSIGSTFTLNDSSSVRGNTADSGGAILNFGTLILRNMSSVTVNTATTAGRGIYNYAAILNACDGTGVDEWTGAISPNTPDDPPTPTLITCT